jgi:hypothetical protein
MTSRNHLFASPGSPNATVQVPITEAVMVFKVLSIDKRCSETKYAAKSTITFIELKGQLVNDYQVIS